MAHRKTALTTQLWKTLPWWGKLGVSMLAIIAMSYGASEQLNKTGVLPQPSPSPSPTTVTDHTASQTSPSAVLGQTEQWYRVTKVVDGDTFKVDDDGTTRTIRLIGVDTPETVDPRKTVQCFGQEASAESKRLLEGKKVRLEIDDSQGQIDKYGRWLRYAYMEDGQLLNRVLISQGYAFEYTYDLPYRYQADFKQAQSQARQAEVGLWSTSTCSGQR